MPTSVNSATLLGNVGRSPELKATTGGADVATFSVATNRNYKDKDGEWQEEVQWHNIVTFGRQAQYVAEKVVKGHRIYIEGRLQTRSWEGQDGNKRYITEIVAYTVINLSATGEGGESRPQPPTPDGGGGYGGPDDEDTPF